LSDFCDYCGKKKWKYRVKKPAPGLFLCEDCFWEYLKYLEGIDVEVRPTEKIGKEGES